MSRRLGVSLIGLLKQKLYPVTSRFFSRATLVESRLKGTEHPFRCLFVDNSTFTEYLKARMYEEPPVVLRKWRIWIPALKKLILGKAGSFDLCVAVLPRAYESTFRGLYDYKCTETVRQVIDTSGTWEDVRSRFSKTKRQITNRFAEKYGLGYRMSNKLEEFDYFYHRMFAPHIKKRFGELSDIDSYDDMKKFFLKGLLLFVTKGGEAVAGALCLVEDGTLVFRRTGVLDGDETHVEGGAQLALYYFQLKYANENHLRAVDTMMSAPFLNDGVYVNKKEWGASVLPDDESRTWVYFFHAAPSEKMARFFEKNPTIVHSDSGLKGVIGVSNAMDTSTASINDLTRRYQSSGLHGFTLVTRADTFSAS
jgi:hypothetical protein